MLLQREIKDPRVGMATVSSVKVSRDLSFADVYVSFMNKDSVEEATEALSVLENASGFLRSCLAKSIKLRVMPRLRFHYDSTMIEAPRISALIDKAVKQDQSRHDSSGDSLDQNEDQQD